MNDTATLLLNFGFTARDAVKIARRAHENGLTLEHVQAWIREAEQSTSLHNPHGFVRARIEDGDKLPPQHKVDPHISDRHRYVTEWAVHRGQLSITTRPVTQTCTCGRVVYASHICPDCATCPTCCTCQPAEPNEE